MKKLIYILFFACLGSLAFGQSNYQKVILSNTSVENTVYNIYPNPLKKGSNISLNFNSQYSIAMIVTVTDLLGNSVLEMNIDANKGRNKYFLDTKSLKAGIYFVHIFDGDERQVHRFVVR